MQRFVLLAAKLALVAISTDEEGGLNMFKARGHESLMATDYSPMPTMQGLTTSATIATHSADDDPFAASSAFFAAYSLFHWDIESRLFSFLIASAGQ